MINKEPKISIITACNSFNGDVIDCIKSVNDQTYENIEHVFVDGTKTKLFENFINKRSIRNYKIIKDSSTGIYPALNQGISNSAGDIVGILHSDDFLANTSVIADIAEKFNDGLVDLLYGDLDYVSKTNVNKRVRKWKSSEYQKSSFFMGWMPPHPTMFLKKNVYNKFGFFSEDYKISGDYEFILRCLFKNDLNTVYCPKTLVKMRLGGASNKNLKQTFKKMAEDSRVIKKYNLIPILTLACKNIRKISQFL